MVKFNFNKVKLNFPQYEFFVLTSWLKQTRKAG